MMTKKLYVVVSSFYCYLFVTVATVSTTTKVSCFSPTSSFWNGVTPPVVVTKSKLSSGTGGRFHVNNNGGCGGGTFFQPTYSGSQIVLLGRSTRCGKFPLWEQRKDDSTENADKGENSSSNDGIVYNKFKGGRSIEKNDDDDDDDDDDNNEEERNMKGMDMEKEYQIKLAEAKAAIAAAKEARQNYYSKKQRSDDDYSSLSPAPTTDAGTTNTTQGSSVFTSRRSRSIPTIIKPQQQLGTIPRRPSSSCIEFTDAGTMIIKIPPLGTSKNSIFAGVFSAAWFSAIAPVTFFGTGGVVSLVFLLPFWAAGGLVAKNAVVDPYLAFQLSVGEYAWSLQRTYAGKTFSKPIEGSTDQLQGAVVEVGLIVNDVPQYEIRLYTDTINRATGLTSLGLGLPKAELDDLADDINQYLENIRDLPKEEDGEMMELWKE